MSAWLDLTGIDFAVDTIDAGGIPTRRLVAGEGPDVVFLHGTSGHLEAFTRNFVAHVQAGYRCHAIDMLGHGYTGKPDYDYEIPRYVDHLRNFLNAVDIRQANLAGESLGGWVAAAFAAESPERVKTIQLIAAGGTKANPEIMERIKTSTRQAVLTDDPKLTHKRLNLLMYNPAKDVQEMEVRQRNLLRPETLAQLAGIPTLIIWGNNNPFGDVPEARKMHEDIPGSELVLFEECGHWPQHEHADRYNALAIEFLDKHNR
jgi:2-hydroxy-6-oxonona-2,4-dienedioate hydrolase